MTSRRKFLKLTLALPVSAARLPPSLAGDEGASPARPLHLDAAVAGLPRAVEGSLGGAGGVEDGLANGLGGIRACVDPHPVGGGLALGGGDAAPELGGVEGGLLSAGGGIV